MNARYACALFVIGGLFCTGCVTRHEVKIAATARGNVAAPSATSYAIHQKRAPVGGDELRFREATGYIRTALSAHGMYEAPNDRKADIIVEIDYAVGEPRKSFIEYTRPVFGRSGPDPSALGHETSSDLVGYNDGVIETTVREKHLSVAGYDQRTATPGQPPRELWRVDATIDDEGRGIRGYLPILASAAMDRIGQNIEGTAIVTVRLDDDSLRFIRQGM